MSLNLLWLAHHMTPVGLHRASEPKTVAMPKPLCTHRVRLNGEFHDIAIFARVDHFGGPWLTAIISFFVCVLVRLRGYTWWFSLHTSDKSQMNAKNAELTIAWAKKQQSSIGFRGREAWLPGWARSNDKLEGRGRGRGRTHPQTSSGLILY